MYLGCFKDREQDRDLNRYRSEFPDTNTPHMCIDYCLNGGTSMLLVQCFSGEIEDEFHFILKCPHYDSIRKMYIRNVFI